MPSAAAPADDEQPALPVSRYPLAGPPRGPLPGGVPPAQPGPLPGALPGLLPDPGSHLLPTALPAATVLPLDGAGEDILQEQLIRFRIIMVLPNVPKNHNPRTHLPNLHSMVVIPETDSFGKFTSRIRPAERTALQLMQLSQ